MSRQPLDTFMEGEINDFPSPLVAGSSRSHSGDKPSYDTVVRSHRHFKISSRGDSKVRLPSVPDSSIDRRDVIVYGTGSPSGTSTNPGLTRSFSSSFAGGSARGRSPLTPSSPPGDRGDSWVSHDRLSPSHTSYHAVAATGASFPTSPAHDYPLRGLESELATIPRSTSPKSIPVYPDGNIKVQCPPGGLFRSGRPTFDTYRRSSEDQLPSTRRQAPQPPAPGRQRRGETLVAHDEVTRISPSQARGYTEVTQESVEGTDWPAEGFRPRETRYHSSSPSDLASDVSSPPGYDRDQRYARYGSGPVQTTIPSWEPRRAPRRMRQAGKMGERRALEVYQEPSPRGRQQSHDELLRSEEPAYVQVARPRTRRTRGDSRRRTDNSSDEWTEPRAPRDERRGRRRSLSRGLCGRSSNRLLNRNDTYVGEEIVVTEEKVPLGKRASSRSRKGSGGDSSWLPAVATIAVGTAVAMGLSYRKEKKDVSKANRTDRGSVKSYSTYRRSRSQRRGTGTGSRGDSTGRTRRHSRERSMPRHDHQHRSSRHTEASGAEHERHRSDRVRYDDRESRGRKVEQEDRTDIRRHRPAETHQDRGRSVESRRREKRRQYPDSKADNEDSLERRLREARGNSGLNIDLGKKTQNAKTEKGSGRSDSDRRHGYRESRASRHNRRRLPDSQESGSDSDTEAVDSRRADRSTAQSGRPHDRQSPIRPSRTTTSVEDTTNAAELSGRKRSRSVTIEDASDEDNMKSPTSETFGPSDALVPVLYLASEEKKVQEEAAAKKAEETNERERRGYRGTSGSAKDAPSSKDDKGSSGPKGVR